MFTNRQIERYADVLLWGLKTARNASLKKNEIILIRYDLAAIKLVEILCQKIIRMGLHPIHRLLQTPNMEKDFYSLASLQQLTFLPPGEEELYNNLNGTIAILAPQSLTHLSKIDSSKIVQSLKAKKTLRNILDKREENGNFSWTLGMFPTRELATHAGMTEKEYANQIVNACFLNRTDPIAQWKLVYKKAQSIKKWLNQMKVKKYHIQSNNTDLEITPGEHRKWIGVSGHNIPSFEIFLSPDWRGTNGKYFADQPSYRSGNYVRGIRLEFKGGKVIRASAEKGKTFLKKQLAMDDGANKLGEFSLTDKSFSKINRFMANTLFDENYGGKYGNCHIALGASYSDTYNGKPSDLTKKRKKDLGLNDSALHWDIVNTEKKCVTAHLMSGRKKVIYENGKFKV